MKKFYVSVNQQQKVTKRVNFKNEETIEDIEEIKTSQKKINNAIIIWELIISVIIFITGVALVLYGFYYNNSLKDSKSKANILKDDVGIPYLKNDNYNENYDNLISSMNCNNVISLNTVGDDLLISESRINKFKYEFITPIDINITELYPKNADYWDNFLFQSLTDYNFCCFIQDTYFICSNGRTIEEDDNILIEILFEKYVNGFPYLIVSVNSEIFTQTKCIVNGCYSSAD